MTVSIENGSKRHAPAAARHRSAGDPRILVVDDDVRTRHFVCTVLKYFTRARVIDASSPSAALSLAQTLDGPLDLLISDVELSDAKTGLDLAREMAVVHPSMQVVLMSGRDLPPCRMPAAWRFLAKPFPTQALLECVEELCGKCAVR